MEGSRFLITGANGQLGTALRQQYPDAKAVSSTGLDISDPAAVESFDWSGIDVILNAAAYTKVDDAETPGGRVATWKVNGTGTRNLAAAAIKPRQDDGAMKRGRQRVTSRARPARHHRALRPRRVLRASSRSSATLAGGSSGR